MKKMEKIFYHSMPYNVAKELDPKKWVIELLDHDIWPAIITDMGIGLNIIYCQSIERAQQIVSDALNNGYEHPNIWKNTGPVA